MQPCYSPFTIGTLYFLICLTCRDVLLDHNRIKYNKHFENAHFCSSTHNFSLLTVSNANFKFKKAAYGSSMFKYFLAKCDKIIPLYII